MYAKMETRIKKRECKYTRQHCHDVDMIATGLRLELVGLSQRRIHPWH